MAELDNTLRHEIEVLANTAGTKIEWNDKGEVRFWSVSNDPTKAHFARWSPWSPAWLMRISLITHLNPNHPEATQLRPGSASDGVA